MHVLCFLFQLFQFYFVFQAIRDSFLYSFNKFFQRVNWQHLLNSKIYKYQLNTEHVPKLIHHLLLPLQIYSSPSPSTQGPKSEFQRLPSHFPMLCVHPVGLWIQAKDLTVALPKSPILSFQALSPNTFSPNMLFTLIPVWAKLNYFWLASLLCPSWAPGLCTCYWLIPECPSPNYPRLPYLHAPVQTPFPQRNLPYLSRLG